jgi:hypothetical protein
VIDDRRIRWAPMLPAHKLVSLYEANAAGFIDDDLVDDVGWRLWERLSDVMRVTTGRVRCPGCGTEFQVRAPGHPIDEVVPCPRCDWGVTPRAWHKSWEHRDLNGDCKEFQTYVARWPRASSARDRMLLIDAVVHALHVTSRPVFRTGLVRGKVWSLAGRCFGLLLLVRVGGGVAGPRPEGG